MFVFNLKNSQLSIQFILIIYLNLQSMPLSFIIIIIISYQTSIANQFAHTWIILKLFLTIECFTFMVWISVTVIDQGNWLSTTSISFEKRDNIRPLGVWSKKLFGKWNTWFKRQLCIILLAVIKLSNGIVKEPVTANAEIK